MDLTPPSKDTIWQSGLKRKIQQSVVYKRPILLTEINTGLGWKAGRRNTKLMTSPKTQAGVTILVSDKDFKVTMVKWDKEGHFILIKEAIHQKEVTIINLYALNVSAPNFIKHILQDFKAHIDSNAVVVGNFNTPLSPIIRSFGKKKLIKKS
jgi:hypothetical protein